LCTNVKRRAETGDNEAEASAFHDPGIVRTAAGPQWGSRRRERLKLRTEVALHFPPVNAAERVAQLLAVVATALVVTFGLKYGLFVAAAADAYGYVSQADLWASGDLIVHQPSATDMTWPNASDSLAPLGYRPHTRNPADKDIVPIYSPGTPMVMALFKMVGGAQAVFAVVPILGGLAVWATYLMGARLSGPIVGAAASILLAASPTF